MSDLYMEMLQKSIDKQAKKILSEGATEQDRYGHLLKSVEGRDLEKEENDRRQGIISRIHSEGEARRIQREKEEAEYKRKLQGMVRNAENRDREKADAFVDKYKTRLDKAHENIRKEQNKRYFS